MSITGILLDSREPLSIQALKFGGVPTAIVPLDCGDCWASTDDGQMLVVERKTPADLLGSIKDGRLFAQVAAMRERSKWAYLMITGALAHTHDGMVIAESRTTGWRWADVQGALLDVQELGVSLVVCQSDTHYEEAIMRLARRNRKAIKPIEPRTQPHVLTEQEKALIALPGIGLERAGLLLGEHGSAAYAIAWLTWLNSFAEISGIGDGTKHQVRRALGLNPDEWLAVLSEEKAEYASMHLLGVGHEQSAMAIPAGV